MDSEHDRLAFGDEKARFRFLKWQDIYKKEKPFQVYIDLPKDAPDQRKHNLVFEEGEETVVHDVRGREGMYTLDKNGFSYITHASELRESQFYDREAVEGTYLPECEKLIRLSLGGVDQICIFDWRVCTFYEGEILLVSNFRLRYVAMILKDMKAP